MQPWAVPLLVLLLGLGGAVAGEAPVVTDGSLGPRVELRGSRIEVGADLGTRRGRNLFHSFERFGVPGGGRVTFSGPAGIGHVIARVTGGSVSAIDGTLASTVPGASLYLLNPSGILFGEGARLDVPASFHASTAETLVMEDGSRFEAGRASQGGLTVAPPVAFGFLGGPPATIRSQGAELGLEGTGGQLSLVAGDLLVEGGVLSGGRLLPDGQGGLDLARLCAVCVLRLVGQHGAATVPIATETDPPARDGSIRIGAGADGRPAEIGIAVLQGRLRLESGTLDITGAAIAGTSLGLVDGAGLVEITADDLRLSGGQSAGRPVSTVSTVSIGAAAAGAIQVRADTIRLAGTGSGILSTPVGSGDAGDITLVARLIGVTDNALIGTPSGEVTGSGDSGITTIQARESLTLERGGQINSSALGDGRAGGIGIDAGRVEIGEDGVIASISRGIGNGGAIVIATPDLALDGGFIGTTTLAGGNAGAVVIEAGTLTLDQGGFIDSSTLGSGDAGLIAIQANTLRIGRDSGITSGTGSDPNNPSAPRASGNGGAILIRAQSLTLDGGGPDAQAVISATAEDSTGDAGAVRVEARTIDLGRGSEISSRHTGSGDAGRVEVIAGRSLQLSRSSIDTESAGGGGGRIVIRAGRLVELRDDSRITTSVQGGSDSRAGNVSLDADQAVVNASAVRANATMGRGGAIAIAAGQLLVSADGAIDASAGPAGIDGTVVTSSPEVDLSGGLVQLPTSFLSVDRLLRQSCADRRDDRLSSFTATGRGRLPPSPEGPLAPPDAVAAADAGCGGPAGAPRP